MREKITLEKFNEIKERLMQEFEKMVSIIDELEEKQPDIDEEQLIREYSGDYLKIQNELLSYDLSDIPSEAWEGMTLIGVDEVLDLSQTRANIDFSQFESIFAIRGANFKNCQISNLKNAEPDLKRKDFFDEKTIAENLTIFLSDLFDNEFEIKFSQRNLSIEDFISLTDEQIAELEAKDVQNHLRYETRKDVPTNYFSDVIPIVGIKKAIELYKLNPDYLVDLSNLRYLVGDTYIRQDDPRREIAKRILAIEDLSQMMSEVEAYIYSRYTTETYINDVRISETFKKKHPILFPTTDNLPPDVLERYNNFKLTALDIINHRDFFGDTDITNRLASYDLKSIGTALGPGVLDELLKEYPILFNPQLCPLNIEGDYSIAYRIRDAVEYAKENNQEFDPKDLFLRVIVNYAFRDASVTFSKAPSPEVYDSASYPDWIKATGYFLSDIREVEDTTYLDLITSETSFAQDSSQRFFSTLGIENIKRFEKEMGIIDSRNLSLYISYYDGGVNEDKVTSYEEFLNRLAKMLHILIRRGDYRHKSDLIDKIPQAFRDMYPSIFISKEAPKELKEKYYSSLLTYGEIKSNPDWIPFLDNIDVTTLFSQNLPTITTYADTYGTLGVNLIEYLKKITDNKKIYEIIIAYGSLLENLKVKFESIDNLTIEDIEKGILQAVHTKIEQDLTSPYRTYESSVYSEDLPEKFKRQYPELFLPENAPQELKNKFYSGRLNLSLLELHPEWIEFLDKTTLEQFEDIPRTVSVVNSNFPYPQNSQNISFYDVYIKKYGAKALLEILIPYSKVSQLFKSLVIDLAKESKEALDQEIKDCIYRFIAKGNIPYSEGFPEEFKTAHPEIFLSPDAPQDLKNKFYQRQLKYEDLRLHPEYLPYLSHVKFSFAFTGENINNNPLLKLKDEIAYKIVLTFGEYAVKHSYIARAYEDIEELPDEVIEDIKARIVEYIKKGNIAYKGDAPDFIKQQLPEMFLPEDAPEELKQYYYSSNNSSRINFRTLKQHPEWLELLKDKSILPFFFNHKNQNDNLQRAIINFIESIGGEKTFLKLGLQKPKDVDIMLSSYDKIGLLEKWYLKTGKKFIPDSTVMTTIPFEDADKFLANGKSWSALMRSGNYGKTSESVDALIKLAYTFGIFEGDPQAEKKLSSLITDLPRRLDQFDTQTLAGMEHTILESFIDPERTKNQMLVGLEEYKALREAMVNEGFAVKDNEPVFPLLYAEDEVEYFCRLIINEQAYPKTSTCLRNFMEANNLKGMITPIRAHQLFGSFELKYDRDFREFLLKHIDELLSNSDYVTYISAIQKQFKEIQTVNSNRVLTLELAVNYVQQNKYNGIEVGNEQLASISSIAGYTQEEFETLQKIFNYGKMRTFSSIPRIVSTKDEYSYEMIRLTDAFATAAGTLSDCCQELGNCAELDMEHSMTSEHGRLFLVKDELGNIVAQSWVWRNQNVLCFDNIEIPDKAFTRAAREKGLQREEFAKKIYELYVKAGEELIAKDKEMYQELLDSGKITQEQYDSLRLTKITVGLGYNDIANAITKNAQRDTEAPKLPPKYEAPVPLQRELYISDSRTQYVLAEEEGHKEIEDGATMPVYHDDYLEYNKDNITENALLTLQKLEVASTSRRGWELNTSVDDHNEIVQEIANNYGINVDNLRLIITPNFAIIYDESASEIHIRDLFRNGTVTFNNAPLDITDKVNIQIKLALLQLAKKGKTIDTSAISRDTSEAFTQADSLSDNFDEERGISHGTK